MPSTGRRKHHVIPVGILRRRHVQAKLWEQRSQMGVQQETGWGLTDWLGGTGEMGQFKDDEMR